MLHSQQQKDLVLRTLFLGLGSAPPSGHLSVGYEQILLDLDGSEGEAFLVRIPFSAFADVFFFSMFGPSKNQKASKLGMACSKL